MGRKIPGKKHRGVKDPLEQIARRNESLKTKLNAPPGNPDAQEVPKSVIELSRLISLTKDGKFERKKRKRKKKFIDLDKLSGREPTLPGMTRVEKKYPKLIEKPGESEESFLQRVNDMTEDFMCEVEIEKRQDVVSDGDEESESDCDQSKKQNNKGNQKVKRNKPKLVKKENNEKDSIRRLNRRQRLKFKKASRQEVDEFSKFTDNVKFGEIVQQPPQLTARPKGVTGPKNSKPGSKNLLLKSLMNTGKSSGTAKPKLSVVAKRNLDAQREAAVAAYRAIKAERKLSTK